jgi:hypothetical protein
LSENFDLLSHIYNPPKVKLFLRRRSTELWSILEEVINNIPVY